MSNNKWLCYVKLSKWEENLRSYDETVTGGGWHCARKVCGNQKWVMSKCEQFRTLIWTNQDPHQSSFESNDSNIWIAFSNSRDNAFPATWGGPKGQTDISPQEVKNNRAAWDDMELSLKACQRMQLMKQLIDPDTKQLIGPLSTEVVCDAIMKICEKQDAHFSKFKMVDRFQTHIPDASERPDHKLWTNDARLTIAANNQTFLGIDFVKHYGADYRTNGRVKMMTLPEWQLLINLILGFVDFDKVLEDIEDDLAARTKNVNSGKWAKPNADEKHIRQLAAARETYQRRCLEDSGIIQDAIQRLIVKVRHAGE